MMARKHTIDYIARLLDGNAYGDLIELSSAMLSSPRFAADAPDYGLPQFALLFVEALQWFAQANRSGVWTYYEATPISRQHAMAAALRDQAPPNFADWYERGMADWTDERKIRAVDEWMEANDNSAHAWLRKLVRENSEALFALT